MKALKFLVGLALIPLCWVVTDSSVQLVGHLHSATHGDIPAAAWALAAGALLCSFFYFLLPRPVRTYVLAHELTHALWGALMGARVQKLRVGSSGGSVTLTKSNFLIALAPYFFPFYTALVVCAYLLLSLFVRVDRAYLWWMGLVGFTWGFHLVFTLSTLARRQTDIDEHGRIFSYAVIYLANAIGVCIWIVVVSPAHLLDWLRLLWHSSLNTGSAMLNFMAHGIAWMRENKWIP
jgi:hypothetical protein